MFQRLALIALCMSSSKPLALLKVLVWSVLMHMDVFGVLMHVFFFGEPCTCIATSVHCSSANLLLQFSCGSCQEGHYMYSREDSGAPAFGVWSCQGLHDDSLSTGWWGCGWCSNAP
ncbi:hypothetical protein COO60DRAFT_524892 [Scenedesmus sp. NREL 46B-D3]|nr:hypothetical protein COO60DRAFT_524892 [Scenedesmus sp. NREL 46B-D3]